MLNANDTTVALGGKTKCTSKNNSQCYFPDDAHSTNNKCSGKNGRNIMPPRFMNALLLVILCVVLKNEYTCSNEDELRTNTSRQLSEMKDYSRGPKNNICTRNGRYSSPDEQFNNMREGGMPPCGRESRIQMSPHEEWNEERGPHNPRNRDMNIGMQRNMERGDRRRNRYRDDSDEEVDMERGDRRRNRNRDDSDEDMDMERDNRRRRVRGRQTDQEDGGYMYEKEREMGRRRDGDEMDRRRYRDEMDRRRDRDEMVRRRDRDEMGRRRDGDEMDRRRERDEMVRRRDRDEMDRRRDRDEMGRRKDGDEMGRRKDGDEMDRRRDGGEMGRRRDRDEMDRRRDGDEMGRRRDRDEMGRGKEKGREEMDDENEEQPEMRVVLGREVGRILPRGDMNAEMERRRRGKGRDMDEEENKDKTRGKGKDMDMENHMNKKPNTNKNMPPASDIKGLDTSNTVDVNFHVTEADIAQMIDKLEDYVKVDDMFLLFNLVNNNEKNKYIKMQLGVIKLGEVLAQYYKTPEHYKTRQWAKSYQGMTEQLLHNERKSYNKLCTFLQNGNTSHVAFVEFLNELVGIWTSFTKEMEKYWKNYLSSKLKLYWETNNADM
ncbi:Plasmodium exported protein, unknown function [Plasmodium knowlesi strain H]|uniref:Plasmodium RESA N-terminal domain-containing protein n=3 Tax=Plasmodium knowlesi TaxID=5850 RepID=A0A5K1UT65_PLAKH|nr:Plasmodium exported protein (PHIST), unknown function [Plasmodium knowlesi strain H]OTN68041.1 Uncharacterized protein PKNOH_S04340200 [Plasmodium knowlesi]CAA9990282.1 Plasmodium exported protein (PHIST), unknown function [Plasmodium knowlesi strain H]SBO26738.1 Plasmodium exported protein, unknown function [Plasmodium knowlesi strain H]SBO28397.1 Plasmodium exported protein, unknown function [Plasmodium knowlesi strain H]VVS79756.1 Plasmodium exported protein (PHIST), unknown function [Pl|eukprot:XP_002258019.1 hypothetical protein, conserved [Plasmodium knowlesi strain H]